MTNQRQHDFTHVWNSIITQGVPSVTTGGDCAYRGPDNLKCGIGHLITDAEYNPKMDWGVMSVTTLAVANRLPERFGADLQFYQALQNCHDLHCRSNDFLSSFKLEMASLAKTYNLEIPIS